MRAIALLAVLATAQFAAANEEGKLVVHEWGTFTSLQDEAGRAIGGINSSDEPLPQFVHRFDRSFIVGDRPSNVEIFIKNGARPHPDVTMRMETPVIYFHPREGSPSEIDVKVTYNTGVLTEFYPKGGFGATIGGAATTQPTKRITSESASTLSWKNVKLLRFGAKAQIKLPDAKEHVWLAPRAVKASPVTIGKESEQYIFYRGVGHLDSPIKVVRRDDMIGIYDQRPVHAADGPMKIDGMWLADFREDGSCAFRAIEDEPAYGKVKAKMHPATFSPEDYSAGNVAKLRGAMHKALVADGLFEDEAAAMLETWKLSYFKSGGQRLFYLVPRAWTDDVIPLEFSKPVELTRVMVGRIELVTPDVRAKMQRYAELNKSHPGSPAAADARNALGRFGDALLIDDRRGQPPEPTVFPVLGASAN